MPEEVSVTQSSPVPVAPVAPETAPSPLPVSAPTTVEAPKAEAPPLPTPSVEKPVEALSAPPASAKSLLTAEKPPKPEAPTPSVSPPEHAPAPEPSVTYEAFNLPEGFTPDQKEMDAFTGILREGKASQETGQKLLDLYTGEIRKLETYQREHWQNTLDTWKEDTLADPQLGGNRFQTVLTRCTAVLNEFGTPQFLEMLDASGLGNHVEMFRFLNKVADFVGEPSARTSAEAKPPAVKPTRAERRYGRNGANPG